jgi:hypothetical protein
MSEGNGNKRKLDPSNPWVLLLLIGGSSATTGGLTALGGGSEVEHIKTLEEKVQVLEESNRNLKEENTQNRESLLKIAEEVDVIKLDKCDEKLLQCEADLADEKEKYLEYRLNRLQGAADADKPEQ